MAFKSKLSSSDLRFLESMELSSFLTLAATAFLTKAASSFLEAFLASSAFRLQVLFPNFPPPEEELDCSASFLRTSHSSEVWLHLPCLRQNLLPGATPSVRCFFFFLLFKEEDALFGRQRDLQFLRLVRCAPGSQRLPREFWRWGQSLDDPSHASNSWELHR